MISRMVSHRVGAGGRGSTRHIRTSLFLDGKSCGWCRRLLLDHGRWAMGDGQPRKATGRSVVAIVGVSCKYYLILSNQTIPR